MVLGDYGGTEAVAYALLVIPGTQLVLVLNEEEQWDPAVVPYRSSIAVSSLGTFSLIEELPADIIPAGDYDFYAGIQLPYDHYCDGAPDLYYGMARVVVENHDHPWSIEAFEEVPAATENPLAFTFQASARDIDGDSLTFSIDFGDGEVAHASSASHTYIEAGLYNVRLEITDGNGHTVTPAIVVEAVAP